MSREMIGRTVVRLYPKDIRESAGGELVGTLLDAGDASRCAYLRQLGSLVRSGLSARARAELSRPLGRIAASTLCWVAVLSAMSQLVTVIGIRLRWGDTPGSSTETLVYSYIIPALILVLFTLGRNRVTGILGLAWLAIFLHQHSMLSLGGFFATIPLQAAGFALLAVKPRKPLPAGRSLWPVLAVVWLLYQVTLLGQWRRSTSRRSSAHTGPRLDKPDSRHTRQASRPIAGPCQGPFGPPPQALAAVWNAGDCVLMPRKRTSWLPPWLLTTCGSGKFGTPWVRMHFANFSPRACCCACWAGLAAVRVGM
jgi:hypothetical protein